MLVVALELGAWGLELFSVAHHRRRAAELAANELEHLADCVGHGESAAARIQQAHRAGTGGDIFNH